MKVLKFKHALAIAIVINALGGPQTTQVHAQELQGKVNEAKVHMKGGGAKWKFSTGLNSVLRALGMKAPAAPAPIVACEKAEEIKEKRNCDNVGPGPGQYCVTVQFSGGRLGNQLFEVATALSIAKDNNCIAVFPMLTEQETWKSMETFGFAPEKLFSSYLNEEDNAIYSKQRLGEGRDATSLDCFKKTFVESVKVKRKRYSREIGAKLPMKVVGAPGMDMLTQSWSKPKGWGSFKLMSYKIFDHNREYLQKLLGPGATQKEALLNKFEGLGLKLRGKNTCSIHVRRGDRDDFKWKMLYPSPPVDYYKKAVKKMEKVMNEKGTPIDTYVVLSDDIAYAEKMFQKNEPELYAAGKFFFVDFRKHKQKDYEDLWLMSLTNNNIIGNSTFSYWGAYLNQSADKVVVQPHKWFGPAPAMVGISVDNNGISPKEWLSIK